MMQMKSVVLFGLVASATAVVVPGARSTFAHGANSKGHDITKKSVNEHPLTAHHEPGTTVYIPVIVPDYEPLCETGPVTTVTVTAYLVPFPGAPGSFTTAASIAIPTGGASIIPPVIITTGPASANATKPAKAYGTTGTAGVPNVTPSVNNLTVPSLGLNTTVVTTSATSYGTPKTTSLASRVTSGGTATPTAPIKPGMAPKDGSIIKPLLATFLTVAGSLIFLF